MSSISSQSSLSAKYDGTVMYGAGAELRLSIRKPKKSIDRFHKYFESAVVAFEAAPDDAKFAQLTLDNAAFHRFQNSLQQGQLDRRSVHKRLTKANQAIAQLELFLFKYIQVEPLKNGNQNTLVNSSIDSKAALLWLMESDKANRDVYASLFIRRCYDQGQLHAATDVVATLRQGIKDGRSKKLEKIEQEFREGIANKATIEKLEVTVQKHLGAAFIITAAKKDLFESRALQLISQLQQRNNNHPLPPLSAEEQTTLEKFLLYSSGNTELNQRMFRRKKDCAAQFIACYSMFTLKNDIHSTTQRVKKAFRDTGVKKISILAVQLQFRLKKLLTDVEGYEPIQKGVSGLIFTLRQGFAEEAFGQRFIDSVKEQFEELRQMVDDAKKGDTKFEASVEESMKIISDEVARFGRVIPRVAQALASDVYEAPLDTHDLYHFMKLEELCVALNMVVNASPQTGSFFSALRKDMKSFNKLSKRLQWAINHFPGYRGGDVLLESEKITKSVTGRTDLFSEMSIFNYEHLKTIIHTFQNLGTFAVQPWATGDRTHAEIVVDPLQGGRRAASVTHQFECGPLTLEHLCMTVGYRPDFSKICTEQGLLLLEKILVERGEIVGEDAEALRHATLQYVEGRYKSILLSTVNERKEEFSSYIISPIRAALSVIKAQLLRFPGGFLGRLLCSCLDWLVGAISFVGLVLQRAQSGTGKHQTQSKTKVDKFCSELVTQLIRDTTDGLNKELQNLAQEQGNNEGAQALQFIEEIIPKGLLADAIYPNYLEELLLAGGKFQRLKTGSMITKLLFKSIPSQAVSTDYPLNAANASSSLA